MSSNITTERQGRATAAASFRVRRTEGLEASAILLGRALLALLFILAGSAKILDPKPFLEHMTAFSVPTLLLPAVIALELGAGSAILIGWRVRDAAGALAIFCVMTAMIFHHQLAIKVERTSFLKDLAIAGGMLVLAADASARKRVRGEAKS